MNGVGFRFYIWFRLGLAGLLEPIPGSLIGQWALLVPHT
jgi:hypothetical protein